jgi:hypothetical protein
MAAVDENHPKFRKLIDYLARIPAMELLPTASRGFSAGDRPNGWWLSFSLDIEHPLAWAAVQEIASVLNGLSLTERLPTVFKPSSPPPYLNGGPEEHLSWVIECSDPQMKPGTIADWLEGRLPQPVDDEDAWSHDGGDEDDDGGGGDEE